MQKLDKNKFMEVEIPVPWGHVAGKWYGPADIRPILMIHGCLDNAGTWDTLIPLLPKDGISYLAIDLPGHGFSSHIPEGMIYSHFDYIWLIHRIRKIYNWPKVSLIGHCLGAILSFLYAGIFPKNVDMVINLDGMIPSTNPSILINRMKSGLHSSLIITSSLISHHLISKSQPTYFKEELVERMIASSYNSLSPADCEYLFRRGIKKSSREPNKFTLRSDARVRMLDVIAHSQEDYHTLAREIQCPILYISADFRDTPRSRKFNENQKTIEEFMEENTPLFEYQEVSGKHHVHLTHPERVSGLITKFILKCRAPKSKI
ncbi:probable serine hydrolase [Phlebotomus papatasi]|uniref:probable serine hydrolase n=1 Tax=Phlebotomus papatasi TaxID=29031 RepID=UPI002483B647|nr:probable serine hydrolase [Phlebotomus papatasi]